MASVSFVNKLIKTGAMPIHLVRCEDRQGRDCYYFIMCSHQNIAALKAAPDKEFDLNDYGEIIASGFGIEPTSEVKKMLLDKYGFDAETLL